MPKFDVLTAWRGMGVFGFVMRGFAALPTDCTRPRSEAMNDTDDTRIGRGVAPLLVEQTPGGPVFPRSGKVGRLPCGLT